MAGTGQESALPTQAMHADVDAIKRDLAALRDDLRSLVADVGAVARDKAGDMKESATRAMESIGEQGQAAKDRVQTSIEDHPFLAVGLALGAGLLIGMLVSRSTE